ncbi:MAG: nuclease-related domain-containing protein [Candidatus Promineifilaceae bacterium]
MNIVGNYAAVVEQRDRLSRIVRLFAPFRMALLFAAVAVWGVLGWLLWTEQVSLLSEAPAVAAVLSVAALGLPRWVDSLSAEIDTHNKQIESNNALATTLGNLLNSDWTLFQMVKLPNQTEPLDALLLGPAGVYLPLIKTYADTHQNSGSKWQRRAADDSWDLLDENPTRQALAKAKAVTTWLREKNVTASVQPRLVWAGRGLLLQEEPDVPFWLLNQVQAIQDDLGRGVGISAETQAQLQTLFHTLISADPQT